MQFMEARAPKTLDNKQSGRVIDELREHIQTGSRISLISAGFSIYAYAALKDRLEDVAELRLLFSGFDEAETFRFADAKEEIGLRQKLDQAAIAHDCAAWLREKADIRAMTMPVQHILNLEQGDASESISGSVNFTAAGLGIVSSTTPDYNICQYGELPTQSASQFFASLWDSPQQVQDVKARVLAALDVLARDQSPELIYLSTLYHVFEDELSGLTDENIVKTRTGFRDTRIWNKLFPFQKDGVLGAIDKIEKYGGCIIADSVGLGKTFEALAIIKYYELRNDRVLVLCPKKLRENWTIYTQNDRRNELAADRFNYDVLNHTDLSREGGTSGDINLATVNWGNYDLLVIDESHNFRNNNPSNDKVTRYQRLMEDVIKKGVKTRVLMLSATPVNNRMNDIKNQIAFITEGKNNAFLQQGIPSIETTLRRAQLVFNKWQDLPDAERTMQRFVDMVNQDYFKLLDLVTIARSRRHIEKYYDVSEVGRFPKRLPPRNEYPGIDTQEEFPDIGEINKRLQRLTLALYAPISYLLPEKRKAYAKKYDVKVKTGHSVFRQADREQQLVGLVRVNLLKRMESSIHSFALTVRKIAGRIEHELAIIDKKSGVYDPTLDIESLNPDDPELADAAFGGKVKVLLQDMDLLRWRQDLAYDYELLTQLQIAAEAITPGRDQKLATLRALIREKIAHPTNDGNRKILIFTAFADTADYLYDQLAPALAAHHTYAAKVTGTGDNQTTLQDFKRHHIKLSDLNALLTLFSPHSKHKESSYPEVQGEIDVLIATDCISEGQNLQDCDYLVNYDIHWNPVRIIQRFGRIDRIGSRSATVQLVNFWPTKDLDEYIDLVERVRGRMVLLDVSATGEENIIDEKAQKGMNDLAYRKKQMEQLKHQVIDLEDISGGISITDLTFNDFKAALREALPKRGAELAALPRGLFALAKIPEDMKGELTPGVIFVLERVTAQKGTSDNPLAPYALVYITEQGDVRLNVLQAKQILDIMKRLCQGKNTPDAALVQAFARETSECRHMEKYAALLQEALASLSKKHQEMGMRSLFTRGAATLTGKPRSEDYDLVCYLILRGRDGHV